VPNDAAGWAALVEQLRGFSVSAIGIEASGGYERGAVRSLQAAGMPVRQVNPFKLRQFARASGVLAKNDPLDDTIDMRESEFSEATGAYCRDTRRR
jgi:transposase